MKRTTNLPTYSLDKVEKKWAIHLKTIVKMEAWAEERGLTMTELANVLLYEATMDRPFTEDMIRRVEEIRMKNLANRERMKALRKKGLM